MPNRKKIATHPSFDMARLLRESLFPSDTASRLRRSHSHSSSSDLCHGKIENENKDGANKKARTNRRRCPVKDCFIALFSTKDHKEPREQDLLTLEPLLTNLE